MTSLTSEMYKIASTVLLTLIIYTQHKEEMDATEGTKTIIIYFDNKQAIGRANNM